MSEVTLLQSAYLNLDTARRDISNAEDMLCECCYSDTLLFINSAIAQLESAKAKIEKETK